MNKYYLNYAIRAYGIGFLIFVLFDLVFAKELLLLDNMIKVILIMSLLGYLEFNNALQELKKTVFKVNSISDLGQIIPSINIERLDIDSIVNKISKAKMFAKKGVSIVAENVICVKQKVLLRTIEDFYYYSFDENLKVTNIKVELTRNNLVTDKRRLITLSSIKEVLSS